MNRKPIIVFDLDGTLVDSASDILDSLNHCLDANGHRTVSMTSLRRLIGQGGRIMIERALAIQNIPHEPEYLDRLADLFMQHYSQHIPGRTQYFDGVKEALDVLQQAGYLLAVCTNKFEYLARSLLHALDKPDRYITISGGDTFPWRKPDPRHISGTIERAGSDITRAVMVGDSRADIHAARAAGIPVIAVDFGYTDVPVAELEPTEIIGSFRELPAVLSDILPK